jgi:cytochrome c oxidase cbb3-type subunit 3
MRTCLLAVAIGLSGAPLTAQNPAPLAQPAAADLESGKRAFALWCSRCHGLEGTGGMGPPLARPRLRRGTDQAAIVDILENGIPGTAMLAAWQLPEPELPQIAAYVLSLGQRPPEPLPGDPDRGRAVYARAGCSACHIVDGAGEGYGPDLSDIGALRGSSFLRQSLVDPSAARPERPVPYEPYAFPAYVLVHAQPRGKPEVTGVCLNEDSFTIQLRDPEGHLYSFRKSDLERLEPEPHESLMPSYRELLSEAELDDLVSYLMTRRKQP